MRTATAALALFAALSGAPALPAYAKPAPSAASAQAPCAAPERRALDFWVGDWRVEDAATGAEVGTNRITAIWGGCAILEDFTSVDGFRGGSLSQYDPLKKVWRLTGGGSTGAAMVFEGSVGEGGALVLTSSVNGADGKPRTLRMILAPQADGTVRQSSDVSADGGVTWRPRYAYVYRRLG